MQPITLNPETPREFLARIASAATITQFMGAAWASAAYGYSKAGAIAGWDHVMSDTQKNGYEAHAVTHTASGTTVMVNVGTNSLQDIWTGARAAFGEPGGPIESS